MALCYIHRSFTHIITCDPLTQCSSEVGGPDNNSILQVKTLWLFRKVMPPDIRQCPNLNLELRNLPVPSPVLLTFLILPRRRGWGCWVCRWYQANIGVSDRLEKSGGSSRWLWTGEKLSWVNPHVLHFQINTVFVIMIFTSVLLTLSLWEQEPQHLTQDLAHKCYSTSRPLNNLGLRDASSWKSEYNLQQALSIQGFSISTDSTNCSCAGL